MVDLNQLIEKVNEELKEYGNDVCVKIASYALIIDDLQDLANDLHADLSSDQQEKVRNVLGDADEKRRRLKHPNLLN